MKTLTVVTVTTLLVSAVFCGKANANELSSQLHAATAQQLEISQPAMAKHAYQAMLQTVIDVKARLQAEQDAAVLLAQQSNATAVGE